MKLRNFIGNKAFYKNLFLIALPIMAQMGISSFVNLLDNIMVGRLGTEPMSGVAIVNQLLFVFNLSIFGCLSGASIFASQFFGSGNVQGLKSCFRYKLIIATVVVAAAVFIFLSYDEPLIWQFLTESGEDVGNIDVAFAYAKQYLLVMLFGLLPFAISQIYSTALRETKDTMIPMISSIIAILVNLVFNYIMIYGHFGFPAMGVVGAAIATVISRFTEMGFLILYTHLHLHKYEFMKGMYRTLRIPLDLFRRITGKGLPLLFNELLWSIGMTLLFKAYSERGFIVVAAFNIASTANNLFMISFLAFGNAISIIIGQQLGSGLTEEAKDTSRKILFFDIVFSFAIGILYASISFLFPKLYETTQSVKDLARSLMIVAGFCFPIYAFNNGCYFNIRAGGITFITFLFDSVFALTVSVPLAFLLVRKTDLPILELYLVIQLSNIIKSAIGFWLVKKGIWINNLVATS